MTPDFNDLITKLEAQLVRLRDGRESTLLSIRRTLSALRDLPSDVAKRTAQVAQLQARRAVIVGKHTALEQALIDAADPREQQHVRQQLQLLRTGRLFLATGDVAEPLADIDARIADFTARRDRAQAGLDAYVRQAEELLGEAVTTK